MHKKWINMHNDLKTNKMPALIYIHPFFVYIMFFHVLIMYFHLKIYYAICNMLLNKKRFFKKFYIFSKNFCKAKLIAKQI